MNWIQRISESAWGRAIALCIAVGGLVAGVLIFFYDKKIEALESGADTRNDLNRLKLGVSDTVFLDIRKLLVEDGNNAVVPRDLRYFEEDGFYANDKMRDFSYSKISELDFNSRLLGPAYPASLDPLTRNLQLSDSIHIWQGKDAQQAENCLYTKLYPYMFIEKVNTSIFMGTRAASPGGKSVAGKPENGIDNLGRQFQQDPVGVLLAEILNGLITQCNNRMEFELLKVNKVSNVLYLEGRNVLHNITMDGKKYSLFYLRRECILVSTKDVIYMIQALIPSADPLIRSNQYAGFNEWLAGLRIIK